MTSSRGRALLAVVLLTAGGVSVWRWLASVDLPGSSRIVTVGVYENAPKVYTDENGEAAGLFIDLLKPIARRERWSLRFVRCTWANCLQQVADGRIDLMPDVAYSDQRDKVLVFGNVPITHSWSQIYRNKDVQVRSIVDLEAKRIAVLRDGIQQAYLARLMAGSGMRYSPLVVDSYKDGFDAVSRGDADAVVTNRFYGGRHARVYGLVETPIMFEPASLFFVTGKRTGPLLLARIDDQVARWRDDPDSPYFTALRDAMAPTPTVVVPRWLTLVMASLGALATLLLGFSTLLRWQVRRATGELGEANRRLDQVLKASPVVLYLLHEQNGQLAVRWVSPNIERIFGFTPAQAMAPGWWESRLHPDDREAALGRSAAILQQDQVTLEYRVTDATGRTRHVRDELRSFKDVGDGSQQVLATWSDFTDAHEQLAHVGFLTDHDALTGLVNRTRLEVLLDEAIARAARMPARFAVLCIDLDRFRAINDTLGHPAGDAMLQWAARRLESFAGRGDTVARIVGDRFVVVLSDDPTEHSAAERAEQLVQSFATPSRFGAHLLTVTASVGVSLYPAHGTDAETLLKHAELALYDAKQRGRSTFSIFAPGLSVGTLERLVMENALRGAADRGELVLHYQPQVDLRNGELVGVEALVRWNHPEFGLVPPGRFIPLAEETGTIHEVASWVLREACRQLAQWRAGGFAVPRVAVNLSAAQFGRDSLVADVNEVLLSTGLDASCLELEITESMIMRDPAQATAVLRNLKAQGLKLSIDDFGTGHSSLALLKHLPIDQLKIDQSFVRDIGIDEQDEAISRTVIGLARVLGLGTVAEGVEREEQAHFLLAEGCKFAQGYWFSRPVPPDALRDAWHDRGQSETVSEFVAGP